MRSLHTPVDALPDLSDVQVIVYTEYPGQGPQVVEDQVTYPLTTAMLAVPRSKVVRGFSNFGVSFVYVIFEDGTDIYWARSRVLEYLNFAASRLPRGVTPSLGPDATGVGWVYQYVVLGARALACGPAGDPGLVCPLSAHQGPGRCRGRERRRIRQDLPGHGRSAEAAGLSNPAAAGERRHPREQPDVGGRAVEMAETEYIVRGRGYLKGIGDLEQLVVKAEAGTPVFLRDIARVELVPDERRGIAELNGEGEVVGGIAVARYGQNALDVIRNLKLKIDEISSGLPEGVSLQAVYDRSDLIHRAIETLRRTLIEEGLIVALVCIVFLLHARSALVAIIMLPIGVLIAFIAMRALGLNSNIMSLGGIAIAIGAMVDAAIVMIENAHKHLERLKPEEPRLAGHHRLLPRGRTAAVLQPADHHGVVPAGVHAGGTGRADVPAAGIHQDIRDGRGGDPVDHAGAGADAAFHPRASIPSEMKNPVVRALIRRLPPDHCLGHALEETDHRTRRHRAGGERRTRPCGSAASSCRC